MTEWVFGSWTIYDEDREAQLRKEPYWTLVPGEGGICVGPYGRKAMDPEYIVSPCGYETDGIHVEWNALQLILAAPKMKAALEFYAQKPVPDITSEFAKSAADWGENVVTWEPLTDFGKRARIALGTEPDTSQAEKDT